MNGILMSKEENIHKLNKMLEDNVFSKIQKMYMDTYIELKSHLIAKSVGGAPASGPREVLEAPRALAAQLPPQEGARAHSRRLATSTRRSSGSGARCTRATTSTTSGVGAHRSAVQSKVDKDVSFMEIPSNSYHYKIVMVTPSGTEMDMKGHCSAGERILSSLVVRMALIECFSSNCSILALDEPTTNLDKHNIQVRRANPQGLENSLTKLVNESRMNFQLIIITHNESFARKMATLCSCDKYLTLDKNESFTQIKTVTL